MSAPALSISRPHATPAAGAIRLELGPPAHRELRRTFRDFQRHCDTGQPPHRHPWYQRERALVGAAALGTPWGPSALEEALAAALGCERVELRDIAIGVERSRGAWAVTLTIALAHVRVDGAPATTRDGIRCVRALATTVLPLTSDRAWRDARFVRDTDARAAAHWWLEEGLRSA
ncbi:MAG: hypothetical protein NW201_12685 [Gemmatimonadales bacterium]|nr:hypothetical protein [Gemmatimonadales bacterium]